MNSRESIIATAVAKKLKKYLDIQRRELSFDLSDPYHPIREPRPKLQQNNSFHKADVKKLTKSNLLKHEINKMESSKKLSEREEHARINMEQQMAQYNSSHIVSPYAYPVINARPGKPPITVDQYMQKKTFRRRIISAGRIGRGQRVIRRCPPQKISSSERERIVNLTTKLLVATETIALPQNRKQSRESQTTSEEGFPVIPAVRRVQQLRPKSAYSDPGPGSNFLDDQSKLLRAQSAGQCPKIESLKPNSESVSIKQFDNGFVVRKSPNSYPSSLLSHHSTCRPKSARPKVKSDDSFDDDFYDHSSTDVNSTHTTWSDKIVTDTSTQTIQTRGTQTLRAILPEDELFEEKELKPTTSIFRKPRYSSTQLSEGCQTQFLSGEDVLNIKDQLYSTHIEDMSTQTRRRSVEPRVVTYEIYIITGNKLGASTDAVVKINLFGQYGDTGDRVLSKSKENKIPFQRNQLDVFHLDSKFIGKLSSIRIGHNGTSLGDGWYLEKVIVREGSKSTKAFNFQCKKWLSAKEGDGQIVRDLDLTQQISFADIPIRRNGVRKLSSSEESKSSSQSSVKSRRTSIETKNKDREYFDKTKQSGSGTDKNSSSNKVKKNIETKESTNKKNHRQLSLSSNSDSFTTSSDSETEKEKRELEKRKRREKRLSKDITHERPKANLGGIINKVTNVNDKNTSTKKSMIKNTSGHSSTSSQSSIQSSERRSSLTNSRKAVSKPKSKSPSLVTSPVKLLPSSPKKKESKELINVVMLPDKDNESDITSPSSSSESSNEDERKEQDAKKSNDDDDNEKIEFSNKDTMKKYTPQVDDKDDLYMVGFLAGIKANKIKEEEKEIEAKKKEEFEENLRRGQTIHQACEIGDLDRVKELVAAVLDLKSKVDERGWAPIHISAAFGHLDLVKWFSVCGVQLTDETPTGYTAIHLAAMNGHVNCIMILAAMGCQISSRTVDHFTPLHLASMSGHIECVKWLLSNRAKIDVKDVNGRTPLDLAVEYRHEECIQLLKVMRKELTRKDSVMSLLRDPHALRRSSMDQGESPRVLPVKSSDSGVGGESNEDEEWISDTEDVSDVIGRGGDERPESVRRASVQVGRKQSVSRKASSHPSTSGVVSGRKMSKQEVRESEQLEEKKRNYVKQRKQLEKRNSSFLDSIRQDIDDQSDGQNF